MIEISAIEYHRATSDTTHDHHVVSQSRSRCGNFFNKVIQVDSADFEYVETRYNKKTKQTKYFGSK